MKIGLNNTILFSSKINQKWSKMSKIWIYVKQGFGTHMTEPNYSDSDLAENTLIVQLHYVPWN